MIEGVDTDLDNEAQRRGFYEIVLTDGRTPDVRRYLDLSELRRLWPTLFLPAHSAPGVGTHPGGAGHAVSLDPLAEYVARIALSLPQAQQLALAGGGAMLAHQCVDRFTAQTADLKSYAARWGQDLASSPDIGHAMIDDTDVARRITTTSAARLAHG